MDGKQLGDVCGVLRAHVQTKQLQHAILQKLQKEKAKETIFLIYPFRNTAVNCVMILSIHSACKDFR